MSIINPKYVIAYPAQANGRGQVNAGAAETVEQTLEKSETARTLILERFWLLTPDPDAGQDDQHLRARWQLKQVEGRQNR